MKEIALSRGRTAMVDDEDFDSLNSLSWHFMAAGYAGSDTSRSLGRRKIYMHRVIMGAKAGDIIDHINGNTLDNRRENLRLATHTGNMRNCKKPTHGITSRFKGVCWDKRRSVFTAQVHVKRKKIHVGSFVSETEAAAAYNSAAIEHFGEFARVNEIQGLIGVAS